MRKTKLQMTVAALAAAMLMGGCGEEPYTLTEKEEELIVSYCAHIVTKYNTYQKEGLSYVWPEEDVGDEPVEETTASEAGTQETIPDGTPEDATATDASARATLTELFGGAGVEINYVGARLADSYMENSYYAQYPDAGKQYLVLGFDITNTGAAPVALNYLENKADFKATLNNEITRPAELTFFAEDFSTFEGTLEAGETQETVLLFQVPATVTSIDKVELVVGGDNNYQIILENE